MKCGLTRDIVNQYNESINIKYLYKKNSGPGDSRNYGMKRAAGRYFLLLDSDCLLPETYLQTVADELRENYADAFGGPDAAHESFSVKQKAINYAMTSFWSTGGLRNKAPKNGKFQLRSFNMGLSRKAFQLTSGFSRQRIGEDIDLNFRLLKNDCSTRLFESAFVYHKRRSTWSQFFEQTHNFGSARPILNKLHTGTAKLTYWLPSIFLLGFLLSVLLLFIDFPYLLVVFAIYFLVVLSDSTKKNKSFAVGVLSVFAVFVQFLGYGSGFLRSCYRIYFRGMSNKEAFPKMFA